MQKVISRLRLVEEGGRIPIGYGVAWLRYDTRHAVCYPIPLNLALGFLRHGYFRLVQGKIWHTRGYSRGLSAGLRQGRMEGRADLRMELKAMKIVDELKKEA